MILSDGEILEAIEKGTITIDPFNENHLTPNGYDLSVNKIEIKNQELSNNNEGKYNISGKTDFRVLTVETIGCPLNIIAQLYLKSKFARNGIQATFGAVEAGFYGTLTLGMFNGTDSFFEIKKECTICQIVFEKMGRAAILPYDKRSGNYQNQKDKIMK